MANEQYVGIALFHNNRSEKMIFGHIALLSALVQRYLVLTAFLVGHNGHHCRTVIPDNGVVAVQHTAKHPLIDTELGILFPVLAFLDRRCPILLRTLARATDGTLPGTPFHSRATVFSHTTEFARGEQCSSSYKYSQNVLFPLSPLVQWESSDR